MPSNHIPSLFAELIPDRLQRAIKDLEQRIWQPLTSAPAFLLERTAPYAERRHPALFTDADFAPVPAFPFHWGKEFEFCTFRLRFERPLPVGSFLQWNDQGEATLYHDSVPYWGLDSLHQYCLLPEGTTEFLIESVCCRTGIWGGATGIDPQGSRHEGIALYRRCEDAWQLWLDLRTAQDVIHTDHQHHGGDGQPPTRGPQFHPQFHRMQPATRKWLRAVDRALDCMDAGDLPGAHARMQALFGAMPPGMAGVRAVLTGHAHIDLVWLWPERVGEFKATHTFASMNRLLQQYPEFRFGYTQPASYEAVAKFSPELYQQVRARIAEGCWEALGATYVESDTQLACGEALARSFVLGQKGFKELTGAVSKVLWLPDVFGYSACLPQLMSQSGVEFFFTTKLTWSLINRFPHNSFRWQGMDGSEVLVHLSTGGNGYNCSASANELVHSAMQYRQADVHDAFLLPCGYGDGGGGVTEDILERARRQQAVPQLPASAWGRIDDFFATLQPLADQLPVYRGELYLEYHRGVQTTHGQLKDAFRAMERALQTLEAAHALAGIGPVDERFWKRTVFAQFHDYIPGSSIPEVYEEHIPELRQLAAQAHSAAKSALSATTGSPGWFNPLPYPVLLHTDSETFQLPALAAVPAHQLCKVDDLPQLSSGPSFICNGIVKASFAKDGSIAALQIHGSDIDIAGKLGGLAIYEDTPSEFDAWDIDYHSLGSGCFLEDIVEFSTQCHPTEVAVSCSRPAGSNSRITIRYSLRPGDTVLRIHYTIDWQERKRLLKVHFQTRYMGRDAVFGAPFGSAWRPQLPGTLADEAMWEVPGSRWAAVCDNLASRGLFLVTEAKYGFACRNGDLQLSLVRSPLTKNDACTDIGEHRIELAIGAFDPLRPHSEQPFVLADTLFTRPLAIPAIAVTKALPVTFDASPNLQLAWVKPLGPGRCVLRFNEVLGKTAQLRLADPRIRRLARVDLLDNELESLSAHSPIACNNFAIIGLLIEYDA